MFAARRLLVRTAARASRTMASVPKATAAPMFGKVSTGLAAATLLAAASASAMTVAAPAHCGGIPVYGIPGTNQERTFLACKPDAVQRGLVGDIIQRFEKRGYKLVGLKMVWPSETMAAEHYADLKKKPFFPGLVKFFSSGPIVCMCWEGKDIIKQGRQVRMEGGALV